MSKDLYLKNKIKIIIANKKFPDYFNDKDRHLMIQNYTENRKEMNHVPKDPTFWTTFSFHGTSPQDLHCTHKYMGQQDDESVKKIIKTLDNYFSKNPFKSFKVNFCREEFFGENKNVRVLTPLSFNPKNFLPDLKQKLDVFKPDNYGTYKPHVTTPTINSFSFPITEYVLLFGNTILRKYTAE